MSLPLPWRQWDQSVHLFLSRPWDQWGRLFLWHQLDRSVHLLPQNQSLRWGLSVQMPR